MLTRALNDLKNPKSNTRSLQLLAIYNGTNGSGGFITGQRYELIVKYNRTRSVFAATTTDGKNYCQYQSVDEFAKNWDASAIQKGV